MSEAQPTLDQLMTELSGICKQLERNDISLEKALALYARGVELQLQANAQLQSHERRLVQIIEPDGTIKDFDIPAKR